MAGAILIFILNTRLDPGIGKSYQTETPLCNNPTGTLFTEFKLNFSHSILRWKVPL